MRVERDILLNGHSGRKILADDVLDPPLPPHSLDEDHRTEEMQFSSAQPRKVPPVSLNNFGF